MGKKISNENLHTEQCRTTTSIKGPFFALVLLCILLLFVFGCTNKEENSKVTSLGDLSVDAKTILEKIPNVVMVSRHGQIRNPNHRIVHLLDWHYVSKDDFGADLRSQSTDPISDEEIDRHYAEHLNDVEIIQQQQMEILRFMIQKHGLKRIHKEGLEEKDESIFEAKVAALRDFEKQLLALKATTDPENRLVKIQIEEIEAQQRRDMLQLGAAGRLLLSNEIESVLAIEDAEAFAAANPVGENGVISLDQEKNEARENAQLRILLKNDPFTVVVLGGGHDLSDNLMQMPNAKAEYIRVECQAWKQINEGN